VAFSFHVYWMCKIALTKKLLGGMVYDFKVKIFPEKNYLQLCANLKKTVRDNPWHSLRISSGISSGILNGAM